MAFLFQKFQEAVKVLAKKSSFTKNGRKLQFEADINRLFLYTSYKRLGKNANDADAIIDMASKASLEEQQKLVQENIHAQLSSFCICMDEILLPVRRTCDDGTHDSPAERRNAPKRSGLVLAVGKSAPSNGAAVEDTKPLTHFELSHKLKDQIGYTVEIKPSKIPHKDAGQGLYVDGEADVGAVIAIYPGITYSPAYYRFIPGYPRVDLQNPYLITRYDGTVIDGKPWGCGGETREMWDGSSYLEPPNTSSGGGESVSDQVWKLLSKPLDSNQMGRKGELIEKRNPLAFAHYANHPAKDTSPNVMVCPYDFPLVEKHMRAYIPNISFGNGEEVSMKKFGTFWLKSWKSGSTMSHVPILKSLVLVATRGICNEEVLLNYRLSNLKRRPAWYTPVDEAEDRRRWS